MGKRRGGGKSEGWPEGKRESKQSPHHCNPMFGHTYNTTSLLHTQQEEEERHTATEIALIPGAPVVLRFSPNDFSLSSFKPAKTHTAQKSRIHSG